MQIMIPHEFHNDQVDFPEPKKPENLTLSVENCELKLDWATLDHPPPATRIVVVPANPNRSNFTINSTIEGVSYTCKYVYLGIT